MNPGTECVNPEFRVTLGTRVPCDSGNTELWVIPGTRSSGWLGEPGVPGELGNPEFHVTPGNREPRWLRSPEFGVIPVTEFGNPEFRVTPVTRNSGSLGEHGVPGDSGNQNREPGFSGDSGMTEFRMTLGTRSSGWRWKPGFSVTPEPGVQGDSGNRTRSSVWLRNPVPVDWVNPELHVTPWNRSDSSTRSSGWFGLRNLGTWRSDWLREPRVPRDSGNTEFLVNSGNPEFHVTQGTRSSEWLRKPGVPGDSGNLEFHVTPQPGFQVDSGNQIRKLGFPGDYVMQEFRLTPWSRSSGWLWEPEVPVTPGNRNYVRLKEYRVPGWLRILGVPVCSGNPQFNVPSGARSSCDSWTRSLVRFR